MGTLMSRQLLEATSGVLIGILHLGLMITICHIAILNLKSGRKCQLSWHRSLCASLETGHHASTESTFLHLMQFYVDPRPLPGAGSMDYLFTCPLRLVSVFSRSRSTCLYTTLFLINRNSFFMKISHRHHAIYEF